LFLSGLREAQQQKGDPRDGDLDAHSILGGSTDLIRASASLFRPSEGRMAGLNPRLSGSGFRFHWERQLSRIGRGRRVDLQQATDGPAVHQIGAHQPGEGERAVNSIGICCAPVMSLTFAALTAA